MLGGLGFGVSGFGSEPSKRVHVGFRVSGRYWANKAASKGCPYNYFGSRVYTSNMDHFDLLTL